MLKFRRENQDMNKNGSTEDIFFFSQIKCFKANEEEGTQDGEQR